MTLKNFYDAIGGDYQDVISRLRSERLIQKFVLKFLTDGSYGTLCQAMSEDNREEAFRAAHTIKGVSQNLSFRKLSASSADLTEYLRSSGIDTEAKKLADQVTADYNLTVAAIRVLESEM